MAGAGPHNASDFVDARPFAPLEGEQEQQQTAGPKFVLEPLAAIRPDLTGFWMVKGLVPAHGLMVVYGAPGCGKSFVVIDVGLHIAAGRPWAGRKVKQAGVVYIASEGRTGFRKRVYAAKREHGIPDGTPFCLVTVKPNLGVAEGDKDLLIRDIRQQCALLGLRPGLIIVDTLARSIEGADESSAKDMGVFISSADAIAQDLDALVLVVHHTGKASDRGMRGSSALHGAADAEWEITSEETGRTVRVAKMKDGQDDLAFMFQLHSVEVGKDDEDDPVTTLVTEISTAPKHAETSSPPKKLTGQQAEFMKAVSMALADMGEPVPDGPHVPRNTRGVQRAKLSLYADKLGFLGGMQPRAKRSTLDRHIRMLAGNRRLGQWGEWVWLPRSS